MSESMSNQVCHLYVMTLGFQVTCTYLFLCCYQFLFKVRKHDIGITRSILKKLFHVFPVLHVITTCNLIGCTFPMCMVQANNPCWANIIKLSKFNETLFLTAHSIIECSCPSCVQLLFTATHVIVSYSQAVERF